MGDIAELQARIARLEDIEAIKQLKALYCEICDDDHNPDRIVVGWGVLGVIHVNENNTLVLLGGMMWASHLVSALR